MSDLITQICQIAAEILKDNPKGDLAGLVELVKTSIDANSQLGDAIQSDRHLTQFNQDESKGFQTWVEGGVANIGNTKIIINTISSPPISKDKRVSKLSLTLNASIEIGNDISQDEIDRILDSTENHFRKQINSATEFNSLSIQKKQKRN